MHNPTERAENLLRNYEREHHQLYAALCETEMWQRLRHLEGAMEALRGALGFDDPPEPEQSEEEKQALAAFAASNQEDDDHAIQYERPEDQQRELCDQPIERSPGVLQPGQERTGENEPVQRED